MGEGTRAVGKLIICIIAAFLVGGSIYGSFTTFGIGQYLGFQYAAEVLSILAGLLTLVITYFLMMTLKHQL